MAILKFDFVVILRALCLIAIVSAYEGAFSNDHQGLFGTPTTYTNTRRYLNELRDPYPFDLLSLEEKHSQLLEQQCKPVVLYLVGRHAARFPDTQEINRFHIDLPELVDFMQRYSKTKLNKSYLNWTLEMDPMQNDITSFIGANEQRGLAVRLKRLYPEFFDARHMRIELGTTSKFRTVQTAVEFAKEIKDFHIHPSCHPSVLPTSDTSSPAYNVESVLRAPCYYEALKKLRKIQLEYHKVCKQQIKEMARENIMVIPEKDETKEKKPGQVEQLKEEVLMALAEKIRSRFSMSLSPPPNLIESAFNVCTYETATKSNGKSIWCDFFDAGDLAALEYLEDAKLYQKTAKGLTSNVIQSCPLVKDMLEKIMRTEYPGPGAYFGFTHVGVLKKLLSTLGFFGDESDQRASELAGQGYSAADLEQFRRTKEVPKRRRWRSSVMMPFSANVGFVLYQCDSGSRRQEPELKVLTSISERPIRVRGCSDSACPIREFAATYEHMLGCDVNLVCDEVAKAMGAYYDPLRIDRSAVAHGRF